MNKSNVNVAHYGATALPVTFPSKPDAFERLPINLSVDEIRTLVREALG